MAFGELNVLGIIQLREPEIAAAVLYILQDKVEKMQSQLGYIKTLDRETIKVWRDGNNTEVNRLEWISATEAEIATCQEHIDKMKVISG